MRRAPTAELYLKMVVDTGSDQLNISSFGHSSCLLRLSPDGQQMDHALPSTSIAFLGLLVPAASGGRWSACRLNRRQIRRCEPRGRVRWVKPRSRGRRQPGAEIGVAAACACPTADCKPLLADGSFPRQSALMLKGHEGAQVDIIDRLPTPFGLVRSGVAPDHPETKIVVNQFSRVAANGRCSFFGNVTLGRDISLPELRKTYHVVVLAYGAESDRSLGIPGEDLKRIHSAREFVWWYNGHPDMCDLSPDFRNTESAVVLGQGNVALDVARILLRCKTELATTDISDYALDALRGSTIRKVYLVGRRGPVQAACTAKELREILGLKNVRVCIKEADLVTSPADEEEIRNSRIQRRVYELLSKAASAHKDNNYKDQKELHFVFFRRPTRFIASENGSKVGAVQLEKTALKGDEVTGKQVAVGTGEFEELKCGLVLKSIGYKSLPVQGLPFDKTRGVVPNLRGRVLSCESETATVETGLYVVGWLKRGPTGIVATNLHCAEETVASILEDDKKGVLRPPSNSEKHGRPGLLEILEQKNVRFVPFSGWEKIDSKEKMAGQPRNKPREKITTWDGLLEAANV